MYAFLRGLNVSTCIHLLFTCLTVVWMMDATYQSLRSSGKRPESCESGEVNKQNGGPSYSRSDLLDLRDRYKRFSNHQSFSKIKECLINFSDKTIIRRKRGKRGGVRVKLRKRYNRPPLPSVILSNARSINNKLDELKLLCRYDNTFRESCLIAITETFLHEETDDQVAIDNFTVYRADRSRTSSGKEGGGGCCLYVNNSYCTDVTVHERLSTPLYDMLCVSMRPFYLPREFPKIIVCVIYVPIFHTGENSKSAATEIANQISSLQSKFPGAPVLAMGDMNACTLVNDLPSLYQYVDIKTRLNKTLDVCYGSIPNAYTSIPLPKLGRSDHQTVLLRPKYKPLFKRVRPEYYTARTWSDENLMALQACYELTDWSTLIDPNKNIDQNLDTVNSYIIFCLDSIMPPKKKKRFANSKPWFTVEIYNILKEKKHHTNDDLKIKQIDREARSAIRREKRKFKKKTEEEFSRMNTKVAYEHLRTMTNDSNSNKPSPVTSQNPLSFATELNTFYNRFDKSDFSTECARLMSDGQFIEGSITITNEDVQKQLRKVKPNKAAGPDGLPAKLLHKCADSLAPAFQPLFQKSIEIGTIPKLWKTSTIIPVPKKPKSKELNNFRPVALTPLPMKCLEKIVLKNLLPFIEPHLDPLQFAYRSGRGVEDAIAVLLHKLLKHIETPSHYARILFADFSSAFNTMQRHILIEKLQNVQVPTELVQWTLDFLSDRRQRVKVGDTLSPELTTNTGAPQGCVLSPFLYITYTNNCQCSGNCTCIKFADDSAILGLISDSDSETQYFQAIDNFSNWCNKHHLELNVSKTKELIVDFRRGQNSIEPVMIGNDAVEIVDTFKYLGVVLDSKLDFKAHVQAVQKKSQQRLHVLRRLRSFELDPKLIQNLYRSIIEPILTYCGPIVFPSLSISERNKLLNISRSAEKISGKKNPKISDIVHKATVHKAQAISKTPEHPLFSEFTMLPSGRRYRSINGKKAKYMKSFVPSAIRALNGGNSDY